MNRFRAANNQRLTKSLFFEESEDKSLVVYTLKDSDHTVGDVVYPSLYRLYMESDDLTEYSFAVAHLDGWEHWQMLCNCTWFKPFHERWKKELEVRTLSKSLARLRAEAASSSKNSYLANKFLVERGWLPKEEKSPVGRPTKDRIKQEADALFHSQKQINDDLERLKDLN